MAIVGGSPKECFDTFKKHLGALLSKVLSEASFVHAYERDSPGKAEAYVGLWQGEEAVLIPVDTEVHGRLFLGIVQLVRAEDPKSGQTEPKTKKKAPPKSFKLTTIKYWYRLQADSGPQSKALIRWEYDRREGPDKDKKHPRHHVQLAATTSSHDLDLNKLHVPTGWVTIEEVLRFLINDLGVKPPCGEAWDRELQESERTFREKFSTLHD